MHRLNIFLSRSGPRAGRALFLFQRLSNPNPIQSLEMVYRMFVIKGLPRDAQQD